MRSKVYKGKENLISSNARNSFALMPLKINQSSLFLFIVDENNYKIHEFYRGILILWWVTNRLLKTLRNTSF
jgi:hypothetical protein